MDKSELLSTFTSKVDEFAKYMDFIEKAQANASKFKPAVVEKVISTNREKLEAVAVDIVPASFELESVVGDLEGEKQSILEGVSASEDALQELELRHAIGELDDEAFGQEADGLKKEVEEANAKVAGIDEELEAFRAILARWKELGTNAGVLDTEEPEADDGDDEAAAEVDEVEPEAADEVEVEEVVVDEATPMVEADAEGGVHAERMTVQEDVSVVFGGAGEVIETGGGSEEVLQVDDGDLDILADDGEVEIGDSEGDEDDDRVRRAVLLYQEGTAEELAHPVEKDVVSLGRGRDNDIQVKNDSKVSRYHCKIYRRGPNYYIEDNKSANGSLVNGELITERRLFGGEEIIIGETFFRFRILD